MQLKEPPLVKPDVNELHPDVNTGELYLRSVMANGESQIWF